MYLTLQTHDDEQQDAACACCQITFRLVNDY